MQKFLHFLFCSFLLFSSCHLSQKVNPDSYTLKPTDTQLLFPLDERTKIYIYSMQVYTDPNGEEFLVFQNENYSQLLFYKMNTQKLYKKISCDYEGPHAVPTFSGFYVRNMNEIYVTHLHYDGITVMDGKGKPIKIYRTKSKEGKGLNTNTAASLLSIYEIKNQLYIPLTINWDYGKDVKFQKSNLCATLNLENHKIEALSLTFRDILEREEENIITMTYARTSNGKQFIYSFEDTQDIYVTDIRHTTLKKIKVKSKYLPDLDFSPKKFMMAGPANCRNVENPRYRTILYDPYRKVYYRIAYPKTDIEKGVNCLEVDMFGGKIFSIMILNEDFEIIGETLMPAYTYNPRLCFIRKDGLYISESHVMNPNFDENKLCFRRLELEERK